MAKRERYVWLCINRRPDGHPKGSCAERGSEKLYGELKEQVAVAGLHRRVRVMTSSCLDLCWRGASLVVMPDNVFLGAVEVGDVPAIVQALGSPTPFDQSPDIAEHVVPSDGFDEPRIERKEKNA